MVETWGIWIVGIGLVSIALLGAGWYWYRLRKRTKPMDARTVNRMREVMDEFGVYQDVHLHRNRNGSVAVALGECPDVWPEDMRLPDDQD